jgi:hypothetical protein
LLANGCSHSEDDDTTKEPPITDDGDGKANPISSIPPNYSSHSSNNYKAKLFARIDTFSANPANLPESPTYKLKKFHIDKGD